MLYVLDMAEMTLCDPPKGRPEETLQLLLSLSWSAALGSLKRSNLLKDERYMEENPGAPVDRLGKWVGPFMDHPAQTIL